MLVDTTLSGWAGLRGGHYTRTGNVTFGWMGTSVFA